MSGRVGAPKGGRVHWLLWNLSSALKRAYTVRYDYDKHNYALFRYPDDDERRKPIDEFLIMRTCRSCFRGMYYHFGKNQFEYFSAKTSQEAVYVMQEIYERVRQEEEEK